MNSVHLSGVLSVAATTTRELVTEPPCPESRLAAAAARRVHALRHARTAAQVRRILAAADTELPVRARAWPHFSCSGAGGLDVPDGPAGAVRDEGDRDDGDRLGGTAGADDDLVTATSRGQVPDFPNVSRVERAVRSTSLVACSRVPSPSFPGTWTALVRSGCW